MNRWGNKLIIVGSQKLRNEALFPKNISQALQLNAMQYCLLEHVGRSRYNGELTQRKQSKTNTSESSHVYYHR